MNISPILQGTLTVESDAPLYSQLVMLFKRSITSGTLKVGDLVPSELEMCNHFGISRSTVRQALETLEEEELIVRRRGKGTFVSMPKLRRRLNNLYSFSKEMWAMGLEPRSKIIEFQIIKACGEIANVLQLTDGENVYKIIRVRIANNDPQLVETTFVPVHCFQGLTGKMLENGSLYSILTEQAGIVPLYAKETYEAITLKKSEAVLLNCKTGSSGFYIQRRSLSETNEPFEFTQSVMRGDRVRFEIDLKKDSISISRSFGNESPAAERPDLTDEEVKHDLYGDSEAL